MWEGTVNECGWARGKCVGFRHSFLSDWQKLKNALEAGFRLSFFFFLWGRKKTGNSFFPDGHCKIEHNILRSACLKYPHLILSRAAVVWWKTGMFMDPGSNLVCWICNEPRCWSRRSICVCKSDKHKKVGGWKKNSYQSYQTWSLQEERANVYSVIPPGLLRLLPSTSALICGYLVCTPR